MGRQVGQSRRTPLLPRTTLVVSALAPPVFTTLT